MSTDTNLLLSFIIGIISSVIASVLLTRYYYRNKYKQEHISTVDRFLADIETKLSRVRTTQRHEIRVLARSIIATRNDLRKGLVNISVFLNSDLDRLEEEVERLEANPYDWELQLAVKDTLQVINEKWAGKKAQLEFEMRKLLSELGIEQWNG